MSMYKADINKAKCMYLMTKEEKVFDKYNEISEKVSNIVKNFI